MILDHLSQAEKYYHIHPNFYKAFDCLQKTNLFTLPVGRTDIEGDNLFILIAKDDGANERRKLETHRKYIDIHYAIEGSFPLEWRNADSCSHSITKYNDTNDVQMYADSSLLTIHLTSGLFAIFFPCDAHTAQPPKTSVLKAVVKITV